MTEKQKYTVLQKFEEFETREYFSGVSADVVIESDRSTAGNKAFRPLFTYISTNKISMTAPVLQEELSKDKWMVSFVMPADSRLADLPQPFDTPVTLRQLDGETVAALRFSGGSNDSLLRRKEERLRILMKSHGLIPEGNARVARFNPPWIPTFMRHNEINIRYRTG